MGSSKKKRRGTGSTAARLMQSQVPCSTGYLASQICSRRAHTSRTTSHGRIMGPLGGAGLGSMPTCGVDGPRSAFTAYPSYLGMNPPAGHLASSTPHKSFGGRFHSIPNFPRGRTDARLPQSSAQRMMATKTGVVSVGVWPIATRLCDSAGVMLVTSELVTLIGG